MSLACEICYELYAEYPHDRRPRALPLCGHDFCTRCIASLCRTDRVATCPKCRTRLFHESEELIESEAPNAAGAVRQAHGSFPNAVSNFGSLSSIGDSFTALPSFQRADAAAIKPCDASQRERYLQWPVLTCLLQLEERLDFGSSLASTNLLHKALQAAPTGFLQLELDYRKKKELVEDMPIELLQEELEFRKSQEKVVNPDVHCSSTTPHPSPMSPIALSCGSFSPVKVTRNDARWHRVRTSDKNTNLDGRLENGDCFKFSRYVQKQATPANCPCCMLSQNAASSAGTVQPHYQPNLEYTPRYDNCIPLSPRLVVADLFAHNSRSAQELSAFSQSSLQPLFLAWPANGLPNFTPSQLPQSRFLQTCWHVPSSQIGHPHPRRLSEVVVEQLIASLIFLLNAFIGCIKGFASAIVRCYSCLRQIKGEQRLQIMMIANSIPLLIGSIYVFHNPTFFVQFRGHA